MHSTILIRAAMVVTIALAIGAPAAAQSAAPTKLEGVINDYTDVASASGAWHITGDWSAHLKGQSGKVDFVASLTMIRSTSGGSPHTHHVALTDGQVTAIPNGYRISGQAAITSNGALAGFTGSHIDIELTGSTALTFSNVKITFGGAGAIGHFGDLPLDGVVTIRQ
jgi:hypothetical protein